jgi:hypothetical protein
VSDPSENPYGLPYAAVGPPAGRGRPPTAGLVVAGVVLVVVLAGAGLAVWSLLRGGVDHPDEWDERVADLVAFVEEERGLDFEHPVHVDFLSGDEFREEVTAREELDDDEQAELETTTAMLRAVGLVSGDVDLLDIGDQLVGEGVAGFYRFEDERIVVRGDDIDDTLRATVVHELVHALQDQHFGIGDVEHDTSGESAAFTAFVEADAMQVEQAWIDSLPADRRQEVERARLADAEGIEFDEVPEVFVELMGFPYVFGPMFLDAVLEERGQEGRDALFTDPPTTEEHIVRPQSYLDGELPEEVPTPEPRDGGVVVEDSEGDFGMLSLLVVLAERVEFEDAWRAVRGWAGDATVAHDVERTVGGEAAPALTCIDTEVVFETAGDAAHFGDVFDTWADGLPAEQVTSGRTVRWGSCDPGVDADLSRAPGHVSGIQGLALLRGIEMGFTAGGVPADVAECTAEALIDEVGAAQLMELETTAEGDLDEDAVADVQASVLEVMGSCT